VRIPIGGIMVFLNNIFTVFLDLDNPDSRDANPRCIIKTSMVATNIHRLLVVNNTSFISLFFLGLKMVIYL
jgi:hypothetical protein